jgi:transcriptional regulator with XRE-family HTH domain
MKLTDRRTEATYDQMLEQERLILAATELIEELLAKHGLSRKGLADRLGKSKAHVTQLLSGDRNFTLRTLADVTYELGHRVHLEAQPLAEPPSAWYVQRRTRSEAGGGHWEAWLSSIGEWGTAFGRLGTKSSSESHTHHPTCGPSLTPSDRCPQGRVARRHVPWVLGSDPTDRSSLVDLPEGDLCLS